MTRPTLVRAEPLRFETREAVVDGMTVHYRCGGRGPVVLLLHGMTLTHAQWAPFAQELAASHRVVMADLPGHGGSSPLTGAFSFAAAARLMNRMLDAIDAPRACAIGHSGGGMTLLQMALQRPHRFDALALVDAPHRFGAAARELARQDTWERLDAKAQREYVRMHPGGLAQARAIYAQYNGLADRCDEVHRAQLARLRVPVLLVWGDRDPYFPVETALEMYRTLPDAALRVVPDQQHTPIWSSMGGSPEAERLFPSEVGRFFAAKRRNGPVTTAAGGGRSN
jgi:pimeloyl-ACP methyl ester carboxylesterase